MSFSGELYFENGVIILSFFNIRVPLIHNTPKSLVLEECRLL